MARTVETAKRSQFSLLVSFAIVIAGLYFARDVLIPIALAVLFSFLLAPPVRWLEDLKLPRSAATVLVVLIAVGAVGGAGYAVGRQLASVVEQLPTYKAQLNAKVHRIREHGGFFTRASNEVHQMTAASPATPNAADGQPASGKPTPDNPLPVREYPAASPFGILRDYASSIMSPLATAALVIVFVIFMLMSREDLRDRVLRLLGHGQLNVTTQALDEASTRISSYLGALSIVNGCYGLVVALGLWLISKALGEGHTFPNVLVWGLLVALCRFVPYVGIWIGAGIPILLAFALFPGNGVLLATVALFAALEVIVGQFVEPMWYGASTGMSALAVLVSAVFWAWLWGGIGLLLSTPLTVILVVVGKYVPQLKFLDILLRDGAVLTPPYRFYQRLIASDQDEASDLASEYLKEKRSLEAAYEDLLVPTLHMAETDSHHERVGEDQLQFVRQSVREILEELAEQFREMRGKEAPPAGREPLPRKEGSILSNAASSVAAAASSVASVASNVANRVTGGSSAEKRGEEEESFSGGNVIIHRPVLPQGCSFNVLCLPARDEADELVALMLGNLLEARGYCSFTPTADALASEMVELISSRQIDLVCVSAMPPGAVAHARYLCKRVHLRFPDMPMIVGLWTSKVDLARAKDRIACSTSVRVVASLNDAQTQIEQLAQPIVMQRATYRPREGAGAEGDGSAVLGNAAPALA